MGYYPWGQQTVCCGSVYRTCACSHEFYIVFIQTNPRSPDFQHKLTKDPLWLDGWYNPSWVKERLTQDDIPKTQQEVECRGHNVACTSWKMLSFHEAILSLEEGLLPPPTIEEYVYILQKCRNYRDRACTLRLHAYMHKCELAAHTSLGNYLVSMLVEVGSMHNAQQVFDGLISKNQQSWYSLIDGYVKCEMAQHAVALYKRLQEQGCVPPSARVLLAVLKACTKLKDLDTGFKVHAEVVRFGWLETNLFLGSTLVDMYAKCGALSEAQNVSDKLPVQDVVSWTALIAGYAEYGQGRKALHCFEQMQSEGVFPNDVTFICCLHACGSLGATDCGIELHAEVERKGLLVGESFVASTLVDMYAKCGFLAKAQDVFDKLPTKNIAIWNALIAGYCQQGRGEEAIKCFDQMHLEGVSPNAVSYVCTLKACSSLKATSKGIEMHDEMERKGLLERDLAVGNALLNMYAKCGLFIKAREVFDKLPARDEVSWTALMARYVEYGYGEEALGCFQKMQCECIPPNAITFLSSLKACGSTGAGVKGEEIHAELERQGLVESNTAVANTLVDMYAKCGLLVKAQCVFDTLPSRNVVTWNTLLTGYTQLGESRHVFRIFDGMLGEGIKPDSVTFLVVLSACSRACLLGESQTLFGAMSKDYGVIPALKHHACMVDLLARAGELDKASVVIERIPFRPNLVVWRTVLGACGYCGNVDFAKKAFKQAIHSDN